jgi:Predicted transcriptional regulator
MGLDSFFDEAAVPAGRIDRGDLKEQPAEIAFQSMDELFAVLTPNRWRLLKALKTEGPVSIRRLSRVLGRDIVAYMRMFRPCLMSG